MSNRHLSRSIVLQTLFEADAQKVLSISALEGEESLARNAAEFAPGLRDLGFAGKLLKEVLSRRETIDEIIVKAAPDWPMEKISMVDRNILRIGLYELLFGSRDEVPPKVAIDEAIELAKTFGGETSSKFVNGVLGAIYKEMGEPEKNQTSKKKDPLDISKMPRQTLGGAVVYSRDGNNNIQLAFVHDIFGHWTLSKGKLEEGEEVEAGTIREIREELGIDVVIKEKIGENEYTASNPEKGKLRKHVVYFLAEGKFGGLKLENNSGGLDDARWFPLDQIENLNIYDDILPIITKGISKIEAHSAKKTKKKK